VESCKTLITAERERDTERERERDTEGERGSFQIPMEQEILTFTDKLNAWTFFWTKLSSRVNFISKMSRDGATWGAWIVRERVARGAERRWSQRIKVTEKISFGWRGRAELVLVAKLVAGGPVGSGGVVMLGAVEHAQSIRVDWYL
jgi:hypothetical protein